MRELKFSKIDQSVKLIPENTADLWHLERVLEKGDRVRAKSFRRFKPREGEETEKRESGEKKLVTIEVEADQIEFARHENYLRVTGVIKAGHPEEYVQLGSFHTVDIELERPVEIRKPAGWREWALARLRKAVESTKRPVLDVIVLDDSRATFATLHGYGVEIRMELPSGVSGKGEERREEKVRQYYGTVAAKVAESTAPRIVIAGPGFTKENIKKFIEQKYPEVAKKISYESASTAEESGVYELLKGGVLSKISGEQRVEEELKLIERVLAELGRQSGLAVVGEEKVKTAIDYKACEMVMVTDELLRLKSEIADLLEAAERGGTKIEIFSAESPGGKQLAGFGGLAALLRYKIA